MSDETYLSKINSNQKSISKEDCWPEKVVSWEDDDGSPFVDVNLSYNNQRITYKETREYVYKLGNIMESPRIKEELGEQLIASYKITTGIIFKKEKHWFITNYRIFFLDEETGTLVQIPLKYVDISITNSHSISIRSGAIAGGATPGFIYAGMGFTNGESSSRRIGDNVLFNGQIIIRIPNISDPTGLKQIIYQIKKQIHDLKD